MTVETENLPYSWTPYKNKYAAFFSMLNETKSCFVRSSGFHSMIIEMVDQALLWKRNGIQIRYEFIGYSIANKAQIIFSLFDLKAHRLLGEPEYPALITSTIRNFERIMDLNLLTWNKQDGQSFGVAKTSLAPVQSGALGTVVTVPKEPPASMFTDTPEIREEKRAKIRTYFREKYPAAFPEDVLTNDRWYVLLCDEYVRCMDDLGVKVVELDNFSRKNADAKTCVSKIRFETGRVIVSLANFEVGTKHQFNTDPQASHVGVVFSDRLSKICQRCGSITNNYTFYHKGESIKACKDCASIIRGF